MTKTFNPSSDWSDIVMSLREGAKMRCHLADFKFLSIYLDELPARCALCNSFTVLCCVHLQDTSSRKSTVKHLEKKSLLCAAF